MTRGGGVVTRVLPRQVLRQIRWAWFEAELMTTLIDSLSTSKLNSENTGGCSAKGVWGEHW